MPAPCDVVVVGAGLSGLYAARLLASAGIEVMVLEAQNRVGGRTLTTYFGDGTFVDDGGQWISPGQHCIVKLADELGVRLFPSWSDGAMVHWRAGVRAVSNGLFLPEDGNSAAATHEAAKVLSEMAETFPPDEPWAAPESAQWDRTTLHSWLATHVTSEPGPPRAGDFNRGGICPQQHADVIVGRVVLDPVWRPTDAISNDERSRT